MPLPNCSICIEPLTLPVSLPCGHVYCRRCVRKTVESGSTSKGLGIQHLCPSCRAPYSIITIDPALVPPCMQPHVRPSIRPLYLDDPSSPPPVALSSSLHTTPPVETSPTHDAASQAELTSLRLSCALWRRRAEQHASANHGLLSFARAAKDCALRLRSERDAARTRCTLLKRTLAEALPRCQSEFSFVGNGQASASLDPEFVDSIRSHLTSDTADCATDAARARAHVRSGGGNGLPVYLVQAATRPAEMYYDHAADVEASHFGPPLKRKRVVAEDEYEGSPSTTRSRSRSRSRSPSRSPRSSSRSSTLSPASIPRSTAAAQRTPSERTYPSTGSLGAVCDGFPMA